MRCFCVAPLALIVPALAACSAACSSDDSGASPSASVTPSATTPTTKPTGTGAAMPPTPPAYNKDPDAYTLTMYAIPAPSSLVNPAGLSWKTPGGLVRRTLVNEGGGYIGFTRTIGHAGVRLQCDTYGSKAAAHFQGSMTNVDSKDFNNLVVTQEVGLGMLIDNVPGRIEPEATLQGTIDDRIANGRMAFIRFQISPDICHDLLDYEKAYDAANVQKNYGLMARPLYKEGAGCSAFTMSFLELADLIEPRFLQNWSFSVRIPLWTKPLIGSPSPLIGGSMYPQNKVPVSRLTTLTRDWATPQEEGVDLFGWDPTMMYDWIDARAAEAQTDQSEPVEVKGKIKGLVLDRRATGGSPALLTAKYFKI